MKRAVERDALLFLSGRAGVFSAGNAVGETESADLRMVGNNKKPDSFLPGFRRGALESYAVFWHFHYAARAPSHASSRELVSRLPLGIFDQRSGHIRGSPSPRGCLVKQIEASRARNTDQLRFETRTTRPLPNFPENLPACVKW